MTPAATKSAKPDIVLLANAEGQVKNVVPPAKSAAKKAPARKRNASSSTKDLSAAADELLAKAEDTTKASEGKTKKAAPKATSVKSTAKKTTAKKAATTKAKPAAAKPAAPELTAEEKAKAASAEKEAKAKALASIKIGPKGVYTEDSIRVYLQEIGRIRLLRPDEEIELARKIADLLHLEELAAQFESDNGREPDKKEWAALVEMPLIRFRRRLMLGRRAKEKMVQSNLRLVVSIAKKYMNRGLSFQDLIQEGSLGLIRAAEKFDHEKGYKFSTYATWWIRQAITRSIADQARTIRIPVHMIETINKLNRISRQMLQEMGREPTPEELGERMEMPEDKIRKVLKIAKEPISMETPIGDDDDSHLGDFIEDINILSPVDLATNDSLTDATRDVLNGLTMREAKVLRMRFGIDMNTDHTLEEVGKQFDVTRERIRQIEAKALRKLRHPSRSDHLRSFLDE